LATSWSRNSRAIRASAFQMVGTGTFRRQQQEHQVDRLTVHRLAHSAGKLSR